MKRLIIYLSVLILSPISFVYAQEESKLEISGELLSDQRVLLKDKMDWVWNENRVTLKLNKRSGEKSRFYSEVWVRNFGLPKLASSSELYNKGITDPVDLEIREAYLRINGFLTNKLDLTIGRQRVIWGTADKLNPTDNINPYDLEDILDFGRHRGSDAININYYINNSFSIQAVVVPLFRPANLPTGLFADALNPVINLPDGMLMKSYTDSLVAPRQNLMESSTFGIRVKGYLAGIDLSISYLKAIDPLPYVKDIIFTPADMEGGVDLKSVLNYSDNTILGADMATSVGGIGLWAEAAIYIPERDVIMTSNLTALYPMAQYPVLQDSLLLGRRRAYVRFVAGGDYNFRDGSYINIQYMHGFLHERGAANLSEYLFIRYEKGLYNDKVKISPINGALVVKEWREISENYAVAYMPEITYQASPNSRFLLSAALFTGKGENLFANQKKNNMLIFKYKYNF